MGWIFIYSVLDAESLTADFVSIFYDSLAYTKQLESTQIVFSRNYITRRGKGSRRFLAFIYSNANPE